jgi:hypothetical protein
MRRSKKYGYSNLLVGLADTVGDMSRVILGPAFWERQ